MVSGPGRIRRRDTVYRALAESLARPETARGMIAAVSAAFLLVYAATFTHWHTFDSISYALYIRRFEQTGQPDWLFHPHHLLFNACGWLFHMLLRPFDPGVSTLTALQAFTAFMGALGLAAWAAWVYEETGSLWAAVTGMAALGGSFGWWFASTDGRANLAATALLLWVVYALRRAARLRSGPLCAGAGALLGATCLVHQSHLLFLPVALLAAATVPEGGWPRRLRSAGILAAAFALVAGVPYALVLFAVKGFRSPAEAAGWVLTYGQQGTWWNFDVGQNLLKDIQALCKVFLGRDLPRLLGEMRAGDAWPLVAGALWLFLAAAALPPDAGGVWRRRRAFLWVPLVAFALYGAFFTVWDPGYFVHWFAQSAFLLAFLAVGWPEAVRHPFDRGVLTLCTLILAGATYAGVIAPKTHAGRNPHRALARRVERIVDPRGLVVLSGMGGAAEAEVYVPYFARMQVLALHAAWAEAGGDTARATAAIRSLIDRVLARGNRVYLLSDATHDPGSLRAMARRYGVSEAQIRAVFAPYERTKVDPRGYIVLFELRRPVAQDVGQGAPTPSPAARTRAQDAARRQPVPPVPKRAAPARPARPLR